MQQHAHIFHRQEAAETMRAYVAHNMDENEDLLASLETMRSKVAATQKFSEEGVDLLRMIEKENEVTQAEAH